MPILSWLRPNKKWAEFKRIEENIRLHLSRRGQDTSTAGIAAFEHWRLLDWWCRSVFFFTSFNGAMMELYTRISSHTWCEGENDGNERADRYQAFSYTQWCYFYCCSHNYIATAKAELTACLNSRRWPLCVNGVKEKIILTLSSHPLPFFYFHQRISSFHNPRPILMLLSIPVTIEYGNIVDVDLQGLVYISKMSTIQPHITAEIRTRCIPLFPYNELLLLVQLSLGSSLNSDLSARSC